MGDIVGGLFGGSDSGDVASPVRNFSPATISAGGLVSSLGSVAGDKNRIGVASGNDRQLLVRDLSDVFRNSANQIAGLRSQVRPGFGRLTESRVQAIENARRRSIGNLRENLQRRRVLGSSFGQDALARAEAEFAQEEAQARAQSFLEELDLSQRLLEKETESRANRFQTVLNDLNLQAEIATRLATNATNALSSTAQMEGQLLSEGRAQNQDVSGGLLGLGAGILFG